MPQRMPNPATVVPGAMKAILNLNQGAQNGPVPGLTLELVHLRVSQINGCSSCIESGSRQAQQAGETNDRLFAVAAWRDSTHFTEAERAALALAEAVTRLADHPDPVPDRIWDEAARHYDEPGLASLLLAVATTNVFNRLNVSTRQVPGAWG